MSGKIHSIAKFNLNLYDFDASAKVVDANENFILL